jgi:hypothetical protein
MNIKEGEIDDKEEESRRLTDPNTDVHTADKK